MVKQQAVQNIFFQNLILTCKFYQIPIILISVINYHVTISGYDYIWWQESKDKKDEYCKWICEDMINAINYLLDNIFVRFDNKVLRQIVWITMGTNCAPLIADLFLCTAMNLNLQLYLWI